MKKLLLLILIGFILTSIITLSFTFQASTSFREFEGDDNGDDDKVENSLLEIPIEKLSRVLIKQFQQEKINFLILIEKAPKYFYER
ncbi:MAG: hypothetical protein ACTSP9_10000 [Promethearchaeota archaeon]